MVLNIKDCYNNEVLYINAKWIGIRFKELIAIYNYYRNLKELLESLIKI